MTEHTRKHAHYTKGRVGIVGLGLIGGSFAKAFAKAGVEVFGSNRSHEIVELACIDTLTGELSDELIGTCELIILASYPQASLDWLAEKSPHISAGAIVIDTGGIKRYVCKCAEEISKPYDYSFIGCHPMAGTHLSGFAHSFAEMFVGAPCVIVPPNVDDIAMATTLERLKELLSPCAFGSYTYASADEHDRMIAFTSQLAHVVSNAYVKSPQAQAHKGFSAGSYKDLTRVAQLNSSMWTELFIQNADYLSQEITTLIDELAQYRDAIQAGDKSSLYALLEEGDRLKREAEHE